MTLGNKTILPPQLSDTVSALKLDIFRSLNCVKIGEIQSFDAAKHSAQVKILFKRVLPDDTTANYPVLVDVPVFTLQGGGSSIEMPIAAGDNCIILFSDRNIDAWFSTGAQQAPNNSRCHDISDGIALVGINSLAKPLTGLVEGSMRFINAGASLELKSGVVDLLAQTSGAELKLDGTLIAIKNATTSLATLITNFITALEGLQVNGPIPLTAASIAALEAQKTLFAGLLE